MQWFTKSLVEIRIPHKSRRDGRKEEGRKEEQERSGASTLCKWARLRLAVSRSPPVLEKQHHFNCDLSSKHASSVSSWMRLPMLPRFQWSANGRGCTPQTAQSLRAMPLYLALHELQESSTASNFQACLRSSKKDTSRPVDLTQTLIPWIHRVLRSICEDRQA